MYDNLKEIAEIADLQFIETTDNGNGYPSHLLGGLIGFDSWEHLKRIQVKFGLQPTYFKKKDGWQLYHRTGNTANDPFKPTANDFGNDYMLYDTAQDYFESEVKDCIKEMEFDNIFDIKDFIKESEYIIDELNSIDKNTQWVVIREKKYYKTIDKECLSFYEDSNLEVIGLVE